MKRRSNILEKWIALILRYKTLALYKLSDLKKSVIKAVESTG